MNMEELKEKAVFVGIITIAVVGVIADWVLYAAFEAVGRRVGRAVWCGRLKSIR